MIDSPDENSLSFTVSTDASGKRLDAVLAAACELSRSRIQILLQEGHVHTYSGKPVSQASAKVWEGERYVITLPPAKPLVLEPEDIPLDILFEDDHLIILNKPAGMVVHPSHGHDHGTLVHALLHHCKSLPGINGVERPGIVHRLDKDTSGSLVIAKTETAHQRMSDIFATHDLNRQYIAWCRGVPSWRVKRIELPIGRHPRQRQKMAVTDSGKESITDASVEHIFGPFSQMRLTLYTGRTHQIRVHLAHENLPVLGDPVYARSYHPGREIFEPARQAIATLIRQALHAELLEFDHPISGESLSIRAPLPPELASLRDALTKSYG
ncbi:MAG: RluA family pseudouridine synthase [Zetaproteobacteria bacterium CG12_big_fil_rev_8_21_14_0_65_54_13]|nr:MAG: RluA family pseudouridine synthase [Zetaproteobacteria bacterium CG12_big_fil_rev_8_21_14_0_65_54_13]PIX55881.1 MAG: RluA family pseudouridine synthase [Zetaproteobacteria bacterium CG_4_10_14_3_um_filter_54_28]PJA28734.1 MAG: RluA family pseudouridine synthase [Zetaproteobacteria bacterium CG_4_9_14_3_um_filter_54_145]